MLENEAAQILLAGIVQVVDQRYSKYISSVKNYGVTINSVGVDKLQTYLEQTEVDLTNVANNYAGQTMQGNSKVVVGRVPRLNHKNFNIQIDVTSDREQQVVIRNLLVPKVDGQDNIIPLEQRRQNVIVLDVTTAELHQGRNSLKLNSRDITITSRDTTPLTKIYQLVMQALNGNGMLQQDLLVGQSTLLPHRLLLPRGRTTGLPMQLITVITPLTGASGIMGIQRGAELNTLFLDNLPLNYPLHCDITNLDDVVSMPNLMVKDVKIYHEDNIKMPLMNMY
ncbi:Fat-body protein 1 [Eumeta japonica]|uniref:Fat-body protein 1 n=1 Tax=Eumeta variegata TaxID=151549 RepID=A0A4C1SG98_EUMVA|nr:Fat-body protein 1 [Eumeta japonica]